MPHSFDERLSMSNKEKLSQLFHAFCTAYQARDLDKVLHLFTGDAMMVGSAIDEERHGLSACKEQFERDWSQSDKGEIHIEAMVTGSDDDLWAYATTTARVIIDGETHQFGNLRGSIVAKEESGELKISHMHCSFPDLRNPEAHSFPVK